MGVPRNSIFGGGRRVGGGLETSVLRLKGHPCATDSQPGHCSHGSFLVAEAKAGTGLGPAASAGLIQPSIIIYLI